MREKLFSVTVEDCRVDTFRSGGKGGQNQNKVESGVRIVHEPSGAKGEARDSRSQLQNKRAAFRRMADTEEFKRWTRAEVARRQGKTIETPDEIVARWLKPENLKVEVIGERRDEGTDATDTTDASG